MHTKQHKIITPMIIIITKLPVMIFRILSILPFSDFLMSTPESLSPEVVYDYIIIFDTERVGIPSPIYK